MKKLILSCLILLPQFLTADIERVSIHWDSGICQESCIQGLEQSLGKVQGVENLSVTATSASFTWKKGHPFSFSAVDAAMRFIGVRMRDMFLTVSGTLSHTETSVRLRSSNDYTSFNLLSPIQTTPNEAPARQNIESHELTPAMYERLVAAEEKGGEVTIQGRLFRPFASPALNLIVESVKG